MSIADLDDVCFLHSKRIFNIPSFTFECGHVLTNVEIAYETWGKLNSAGDNAIVVCHALTGDTHVGDGLDGSVGWWTNLVRPSGLFDTNRYFVVCMNVLGGCSGSTGPATIGTDGFHYALRFPIVTVRDMVRSQLHLIKALGIRKIEYVIGGSLGGMQAWEWAYFGNGIVNQVVAIAADASFSALGIGYNEAMRQAITCDFDWQQGAYYATGRFPARGVAAARTIGMLTYRTGALFEKRFGRTCIEAESLLSGRDVFTRPFFQVESYLHHAGEKLNTRFDANTYLYLTRAMDSHDIGRNRGGLQSAMRQIQTKLSIVGIVGDYLYPPEELIETVKLAHSLGAPIYYLEMKSEFGHDAFLADQIELERVLRE